MSTYGVLVPPGGRWNCDKRQPPVIIGGEAFCPTCGRPIRERWKVTPKWPFPQYVRTHSGMWGTYGGC